MKTYIYIASLVIILTGCKKDAIDKIADSYSGTLLVTSNHLFFDDIQIDTCTVSITKVSSDSIFLIQSTTYKGVTDTLRFGALVSESSDSISLTIPPYADGYSAGEIHQGTGKISGNQLTYSVWRSFQTTYTITLSFSGNEN